MGVPKFLTLEELVRDHERLCAEVEELKRQFEGHTHLASGNVAQTYDDLMRLAAKKPGE